MTIGKRKGLAAKGAGGTGETSGVNKVGGSLSKGDHNYLTRAFGLTGDPGADPQLNATGGTTDTYTDPNGSWKSHKFITSGSFQVTEYAGDGVEYLVVGGGGGTGAVGTSGYWGSGGGGGGGGQSPDPGGEGGAGGGGDGDARNGTGQDATANTGGGGGGGAYSMGFDGGSGIVVIRYKHIP